MRLLHLVRRHLRASGGVFATLAVLVVITSFVAAAAPRALNVLYDGAAQDTIEDASPLRKDVQVVVESEGANPNNAALASTDHLADLQSGLLSAMPPDLREEMGGASHTVRTGPFGTGDQTAGTPPEGIRHVAFQYRSEFADNIRFVEGGPPRGRLVQDPDLGTFTFAVAFSAENARALQVEVGDAFTLVPNEPPLDPVATVEVSGIYEPIDAASPYWALDSSPITYRVEEDPGGTQPPDLFGTAMIAPEHYQVWYGEFAVWAETVFRYPPDSSRITAPDMAAMRAALDVFANEVILLPRFGLTFRLDTSLSALLTDFDQRGRTASAVLSLGLFGLLAVALIVIALAGQLATERRRTSLGLVRARGSSLVQLAGVVCTEMAVVAIPAGVLGFAAAVAAVPARWASASAQLSALIVVMAIALVASLAVHQHRRAGRQDRRDLVAIRPSPRRLVFEGLVVFLAIIGVILLHRRGLTTETGDRGTDPFLVAVPVLLGFAAGLFALRAYPYPLRALAHATAHRRGAVGFLGVARASRETLASALPIVVLLLGLALGVFGTIIDRALTDAQGRQAWREVAAEVRAQRDNLDAATIDAVRQVPGVSGVVHAFVDARGNMLDGDVRQDQIIIIAIDLDAYRRLLAGSPVDMPAGDLTPVNPPTNTERLPALVSPQIVEEFGDDEPGILWGGVNRREIAVNGTITGFPGFETRTPIVVVPYDGYAESEGARLPNTLYVGGSDISTDRVEAALGGPADATIVINRADRLAAIGDVPFVDGVRRSFVIGVIALGGYCLLAVLLALVISAAPRGRTVSQLRTLGLTQRQARGLQLLEVGPLVAAAIAAGVTLGVLLPRLIAPAVDLRAFAGGQEVDSYPIDPLAVGVLSGALATLVIVAIVVDAWINRRRGVGSVLRVGNE